MRTPSSLLLVGTLAWPTLALAGETPLAIHIHTETAMFQVLIAPGRVGQDSFVLQLMNGDGTLLPAKAATLVLSGPRGNDEPLVRKASLGRDGYWHVENVPISASGRWHMRIEAQTLFKQIALEDDFDVPPQ